MGAPLKPQQHLQSIASLKLAVQRVVNLNGCIRADNCTTSCQICLDNAIKTGWCLMLDTNPQSVSSF